MLGLLTNVSFENPFYRKILMTFLPHIGRIGRPRSVYVPPPEFCLQCRVSPISPIAHCRHEIASLVRSGLVLGD